ncbi:MAG: hypothetical protein ACM336_12965 [Acidobacteriota bacterium]
MKRALVVLAALLAATGLCAQEQKKEEKTVVRVYQINPANVARIQQALSVIGITASAQSDTLIVRTSADLTPAVDEVVAKLNTASAPKNIELTFYILQGSKEPLPDGSPLPADLQPAINQLKSVFAYQNFRLLDIAFVRGRSGRDSNLTGQAAFAKAVPPPSWYSLQVRPSVSAETKPPTIRIDNLRFNIKVPIQNAPSNFQLIDLGINADLDLKEGQKVVIGKTGIEGGQSALILIATGRVVD